jgi:RNA polymerase sigma-70 factor (ECF subfamily)
MSERKLEALLIKKCREGDTTAFGKLINIYRTRLFTYLLRISRDRITAEDLFQDTIIKVWIGIKSYNEQQKFSSWLFTIAHNISIDAIRSKKVKERVTNLNEEVEIATNITPHSELVATETRLALEMGIEALPDNQKQVFLLRQHGCMPFKEIAAVMNQPLNTVLSHMHYAIKKLRQGLMEEYE